MHDGINKSPGTALKTSKKHQGVPGNFMTISFNIITMLFVDITVKSRIRYFIELSSAL